MRNVPQYQPLIVVGAPRSGTNMLRDVLTSLPGIASWPCDELNFMWRHGNLQFPTDELPVEAVNEKVVRYVRGRFDAMATSRNASILVEKTCANTLRIPFVNRIIPNAKYVFIVRDGLDVIASAAKRWRAPFEPLYTLRKARFLPISDVPFYGTKFIANRVRKLYSKDGRLATWGPVSSSMKDSLEDTGLVELCGIQWRDCINAASIGLSTLDAGSVCEVRYEDFVRSPESELVKILSFLDVNCTRADIDLAVGSVSPDSIGRGRGSLMLEDRQKLRNVIDDTLVKFGYHP